MNFPFKHNVAFLLACIVTLRADIIGHIKTLDYLICNSIENPKAEGAEKLSSDLFQLFVSLDEIHDMLRDEREAGMRIVQKLLDSGGIRLPSIKPNFPFIMNTFNWTINESKVLGVTIKDTVAMWKNIKLGMEIIPTTEIDYALNPEKGKK